MKELIARNQSSQLSHKNSQVQIPLPQNQKLLQNSRSSTFLQNMNIIDKLMGFEKPSLRKAASTRHITANRQLLVECQEKVFAEVIKLIQEIDELKTNIVQVGVNIRQMQIEHPDVDQKVKFHGYDQKLTNQDCRDLQEENLALMNRLCELQFRKNLNPSEVLRIQRQRYEELKKELTENGSSSSQAKIVESKIKELVQQIADLQNSRHSRLRRHYPEFDSLKMDNEALRRKTIENLRSISNQEVQERQLRAYLAEQEQERQQIMEELKTFKDDYKRLKRENVILKQKVDQRRSEEGKQNVNVFNRSKTTSNKTLQIQSKILKKPSIHDKFGDYQALIKRMQSNS